MKTKLAQIKAREEKETSCLINPDESSKMLVWDLVTTLALAYTALITPLEIAFFSSSVSATPGVDAWWALNRVVDIIFLLDMYLATHTAFYKPLGCGRFQLVDDVI